MTFGSEDAVTGIVVDRVILVKQKIQILSELHGVSLLQGSGKPVRLPAEFPQ